MTLPVYLRIAERLTREIAAGLRPDGDRLPPEIEMARGLGVSVGTLRRALAELTAAGLLVRRQGSGNYICRTSDPVGIYAFFHLELHGGGGMPSARTLDVTREDPAMVSALGATAAWRIRRLRFLNNIPAAIEEIRVDARHAETLDARTLPETLYRHYAEAFGLRIAQVQDRIETGPCPEWPPADFPPGPGAICGRVIRVAHDAARQVAEVSTTWFDPATTGYVARWLAGAA